MRRWETTQLPELVGNAEALEILDVSKMQLNRWLRPGTGDFYPDGTYMIPPKRIAASPVWVRSDVERFAREIGRQRAKPKPKGGAPSPGATQITPGGQEIPVPTRDDFDSFVRKVAPPAGRKRPAETAEPREQSD
jgi:hypothetical protein